MYGVGSQSTKTLAKVEPTKKPVRNVTEKVENRRREWTHPDPYLPKEQRNNKRQFDTASSSRKLLKLTPNHFETRNDQLSSVSRLRNTAHCGFSTASVKRSKLNEAAESVKSVISQAKSMLGDSKFQSKSRVNLLSSDKPQQIVFKCKACAKQLFLSSDVFLHEQ